MKLSPRVHLIGSGRVGGFQMTDDFDCHVYLVDGGGELALIDPGFGRSPHRIVDRVKAAGFEPERIRSVLLTHAHVDHAGGAAFFRREFGARVAAHRSIVAAIESGDAAALDLQPAKEAGLFPESYEFEPTTVDVHLTDGATVRVGDVEFRALDTPGHASGHVSFECVHDGQRHLFAGDTIFVGGRILLLNFPSCSLQAYLASIRRLAHLKVDLLLPGHSLLALSNGQDHIDQALATMARCAVPPNVLL